MFQNVSTEYKVKEIKAKLHVQGMEKGETIKSQIVYKVVFKYGKKLVSIVASGKARVTYKVGKWCKAPQFLKENGYDVLAFRNLSRAVWFSGEMGPYAIIFKSEATGVRETTGINRLSLQEIDGGKIELYLDAPFPPGSVFCEKIKLIEEVK